jgi:hypothetical protein
MKVFKPARTERSRIPCTSRPGVDQVLATTKNEEGHFRDPPRISLICFREFGAGEGIRTPDPNLGKAEGIATDDPPVYFWPALSVCTITSVETFH